MTGLAVYLIVVPLILAALAILATWWFVGRENGLLRPRPETRAQGDKATNLSKKLELRNTHYGTLLPTSGSVSGSPVLAQDFVVRGVGFQVAQPTHETSEVRH